MLQGCVICGVIRHFSPRPRPGPLMVQYDLSSNVCAATYLLQWCVICETVHPFCDCSWCFMMATLFPLMRARNHSLRQCSIWYCGIVFICVHFAPFMVHQWFLFPSDVCAQLLVALVVCRSGVLQWCVAVECHCGVLWY